VVPGIYLLISSETKTINDELDVVENIEHN
jgi:hypothetical protein